jgi:hypothetical protein
MAMDMDERWANRSPKAMLETFHWFRGEGFSMIIEDIIRLPKRPGVIAEGFRLAPHLVKPLLAVVSHTVWLLPTPEFRQVVFVSRGGPEWRFLGKTSDPERALRNLLDRDAMFTHSTTVEFLPGRASENPSKNACRQATSSTLWLFCCTQNIVKRLLEHRL